VKTFATWFFRIFLVVSAGVGLFACGGGGDDAVITPPPIAKRTITVTPALGGFGAGATVSLIDPSGAVLGSATTDSNGSASPELGAYTGPFIVRVAGGAGVTFF